MDTLLGSVHFSVVVAAVLLFSNVVNNSEGQLGLAPGLSLTTYP